MWTLTISFSKNMYDKYSMGNGLSFSKPGENSFLCINNQGPEEQLWLPGQSRWGGVTVSGMLEYYITNLGGGKCDVGMTIQTIVKVCSKGTWMWRTSCYSWQVLPVFLTLPKPDDGANECPQSLSKIWRSGFYSWPSHTLFSLLIMFLSVLNPWPF